MKIICIDARLWGIAHTGIGRYTQNLLSHLPDSPDISVNLVVASEYQNEPALAKYPKVTAKYHPYSVLAQLEMLLILAKIRPQLTHFTHSSIPVLWPGKFVVTIHDFIKHQSRGTQTTTKNPLLYWIKYLGFLFINWISLHRAEHIIVPSGYWKSYIQKRYHLPSGRISVTYEAVAEEFQAQPASSYRPPLPRPFVVHTGSLYPHKNIPVLIEAIRLLDGIVHLALVCARSVFTSRLTPSPYVHYLGRLTDAQLKTTLKSASAYVFPSLIEGFGLGGLEAMSVGTPVIAARASCLPEIYGDAALYFDPHDPRDLAAKIKLLISNSQLSRELITKGKKQILKYSWSKMAAETWQIYLKMLP